MENAAAWWVLPSFKLYCTVRDAERTNWEKLILEDFVKYRERKNCLKMIKYISEDGYSEKE